MAETLIFAGVAFLVITVAAAIFVFWVALKVVRGVVRFLVGATSRPPPYRQIVMAPPSPALPPVRMVCCGHVRCRAANPADARYCRRCGKALVPAGAAAAQVRRPRAAARGQLVA